MWIKIISAFNFTYIFGLANSFINFLGSITVCSDIRDSSFELIIPFDSELIKISLFESNNIK